MPLGRSEAAALSGRVAVVWPGWPSPLRLDPLLLYREGERSSDMLFLNRDLNRRQVQYLNYSTGRTERDLATAPALAALLCRITGREVAEAQLEAFAEQSRAATPSVESLFEPPEPVSRVLGGYEILAEIGRGGMGVVFLRVSARSAVWSRSRCSRQTWRATRSHSLVSVASFACSPAATTRTS